MRRTVVSPLLLGTCAVLARLAAPVAARPVDPARILSPEVPVAPLATVGPQTHYFGGTMWAADSMRWEAVPDSVWTFETGVGSHFQHTDPYKNPSLHAAMEGWTGLDLSRSSEQQFRRVSTADFSPNPACVGGAAGLGGDYSFWAGLFEDEADSLCWVSGQGYGDNWGVCIEKTIAYDDAGCLRLQYDYLIDSEPSYDYGQVYVDTTGSSSLEDAILLRSYDGSGSATDLADLTEGVDLRSDAGPVRLLFCFTSDGVYSDEDGIWPTTCGGFAVDDILVTNLQCGGTLDDLSTFEAGEDGWSVYRIPGGGDFSDLAAVADLPPGYLQCDLGDSVLVMYDPDAPANNPHPFYQDNIALSPWVDLRRADLVGFPTKFVDYGGYFYMPFLEFQFVTTYAQWYPDTCSTTGDVQVSPVTRTDFFAHFPAPVCSTMVTRADFTDLVPVGAEQVRVGLGVVNFCRFFQDCTYTSNTTPWFDHVRFGISGFTTIQAAIDLAADGDTVLVPPGTYSGEGNVNLDFGGKDLMLLSEAGPDQTIIDGGQLDRIFLFHSGEDSTSVVEGFTIENGREYVSGMIQDGGCIHIQNSSPTFRNCRVVGGLAANGGGVYSTGSSEPRFVGCTFQDCAADVGGGALVGEGSFEGCTFQNNTASGTGGGVYLAFGLVSNSSFTGNHADEGGGMALFGGLAQQCTFDGNEADTRGGGVSLAYAYVGEFTTQAGRLEGCSLVNNTSSGHGGGAFLYGKTSVTGSMIAGNTAQSGGGVAGWGWDFEEATLTGTLITGNAATEGGGVHVTDEVGGDVILILSSCTVSGNRADSGGGIYVGPFAGVAGQHDRLVAEQTILFGNCAAGIGHELAFADTAGIATVTCSNLDTLGVEGPGDLILSGPQALQNPEFCTPVQCTVAPSIGGSYELAASSPNLPAHNACGVLIGARGEGCTIVEIPEEEPPAVVSPGLAVSRNPFRGQLAIRYDVPDGTEPVLRIYDVRGALVQDIPLAGSSGVATWDGRDRSGGTTPAGVYFLQLVAGGDHRSLRVVRLQ